MIAKRTDIRNPFGTGAVYDYCAIENAEVFVRLTHNVTFIGVVDIHGSGHGIVYGLETIRAVAAHVIPNQKMLGVVFALDLHSEQLNHLCRAVEMVKGYHEWKRA